MTTEQAMEVLGCHRNSLYYYRDKGWIRYSKRPNGRVDWFEEDVYKMAGKTVDPGPSKAAIYVRVPNPSMKSHMAKQKEKLRRYCDTIPLPIDNIYEDYGAGTDFSEEGRPGLHELIKAVIRHELHTVVIDSYCRIAPFYWEFIDTFFKYHGVRVISFYRALEDPVYKKELVGSLTGLLADIGLNSLTELAVAARQQDE